MRPSRFCAVVMACCALLLAAEAAAEPSCIGRQSTRLVHECHAPERLAAVSPPRRKTDPLPLSPSAVRALETLQQEACGGSSSDLAIPRFNRAVLLVQHRRWELAAAAFRQVAAEHDGTALGPRAVTAYLVVLDILGRRLEEMRPDCYDRMEQDVAKLEALYCTPSHPPAAGEHCALLRSIQLDVGRLRAEELVKQADRLPLGKGVTHYRKAAAKYLGLWRRYGRSACRARLPECARHAEILYSAGRALVAARRPARTIAVLELLRDPAHRLHRTELARRASYALARAYRALGERRLAADLFERHLRELPGSTLADQALLAAVSLRASLGQMGRARAVARAHLRRAELEPREAARLSIAVAKQLAEHGDHAEAYRLLSARRVLIGRYAGASERAEALDLLRETRAAVGLARP